MTSVTTPPAASPTTHSSRRWRGDVEGLRAVAVALVLADHAGPAPSGGFLGVDVFFVVSGFVITTQLVREVERDRRLSLTRFYARRATRLLPAAGLVLLTTAVLTWFLAPRTQRGTFGLDIAGAAGYVVNRVFADRSVDYLAEDLDPSPVLHFWSLAVEEQFYLPVYECVAEHLDDPDVCSWPYEPSPASTTPRSVADEVGAHYADMDPSVCPGGFCVGVYRNVLTYRQGSHLTVTFVDVLAEPLEERLSALVG